MEEGGGAVGGDVAQSVIIETEQKKISVTQFYWSACDAHPLHILRQSRSNVT